MDSFDPVDAFEATECITVDGDDAVVHHSRSPIPAQEFADTLVEVFDECEPSDPDDAAARMLDAGPDIATPVHQFISVDVLMELSERDVFPSDVELAFGDAFSYFAFDDDTWRASSYPRDDPTRADVVAATCSLANAAWCVNAVEETVEEAEGGDAPIFSESYFDAQVTKGLMLAFRDAFVTHAPHSAVKGLSFRDRRVAVGDAVENALGIELSDTDLHGLLLADWNKSVCLQSASQFGKQKSVDEGVAALEDLSAALSTDE